jgi:hypothetical protein
MEDREVNSFMEMVEGLSAKDRERATEAFGHFVNDPVPADFDWGKVFQEEIDPVLFSRARRRVASSAGPSSLQGWKLYERSQKMKMGGFSYKETVDVLSKDAGITPKRVKDIIGTSAEWSEGIFDRGLAPLNEPEDAEGPIHSSVVAREDSIKSQYMSGQITKLEAIDRMDDEFGLDYDEADEIIRSWLDGE